MTASTGNPTQARTRATRVLVRCYGGVPFVNDVLAELQAADPLSPRDAALAAELVLGVSRHRITAEHIAARFYRGRWAGLDVPIRVILALAVYQLCWLERIPVHAAVDQAVRQARRHGRAAGALANAVLRKLAACLGEVIARPESPDPRRWLPIDAARGRLFAQDMFPDPTRRPLEYLVAATGHPPWLVERWHRRFKPVVCRRICEAGGRHPPLVLRPNVLRNTADELLERLTHRGLPARRVSVFPADGEETASAHPEAAAAILIDPAPAVSELPEIHEGLCQPQDGTAQIALAAAELRAGQVLLDLCAGVGTKSTEAAELMRDQGTVLATDIDAAKLEQVAANAERLGLTSIRTLPMAQLDEAMTRLGRPCDWILVDAPCTNTGVLARRPDARYRASAKTLAALVVVQQGLLSRAAALAGPATRLIYSTCSLEQEENEDQVEWFCAKFPGWEPVGQRFVLPDMERDGGFAAVLGRR